MKLRYKYNIPNLKLKKGFLVVGVKCVFVVFKMLGLLMVVILLMFKVKMIRIPSAGVGGLCVGIFSSLQGWLCVWVLCALQCAKNSVGSGGKVMGV